MSSLMEITDIIAELLRHPEKTLSYLILFLICLDFAVVLFEYRKKLWAYLTNKRNKWYVAFMLFSAVILIISYKRGWISGLWMWITAGIWLTYSVLTLLDLRPMNNGTYHNPLLKRYRRFLLQGTADEHIDFFRKKLQWLIKGVFSATDRAEYYILKHEYYAAVNEYDIAYKSLLSIKENTLYDSEKKLLLQRKAYCLTMMGSMNTAITLLGDYSDNKAEDPVVWIAYSFIFENGGDMDRAYEAAHKAVSLVDGNPLPDWKKGEIYNDYGRAALIRGNEEEALRYMKLAWEKVKETKDNRPIHVIGSNRVLRMAIQGEEQKKCEESLADYRKRIVEPDAPSNAMEYLNTLIQYYRQIGDDAQLYQTVKENYCAIAPTLNPSQKAIFQASVFRLLMNGHFQHDWFDEDVPISFDDYRNMQLMDRLFAFREYIGLFMQEEFRAVTNTDPFKTLCKTIMKYYRENAIGEINEEISKTESYNVYRYKELMQHKLGILKYIQGKNHIDASKEQYTQLAQTLYDAGLRIESVNVWLTLMDECTSPYNVMVATPFTSGWMHFSDYLNMLPPTPDPIQMPDGIHLNYFRLQMMPYDVQPLKKDVIEENIDNVISEVLSWAHHPAKIEFSVKLANLLMCLGRDEEARELFQIYENSPISDRQYASWMVDEIEALRAALGTRKKTASPEISN